MTPYRLIVSSGTGPEEVRHFVVLLGRHLKARAKALNRRLATQRFSRALAELADERNAEAASSERLSHYRLERGRAVRSYELGPRGELMEHPKS